MWIHDSFSCTGVITNNTEVLIFFSEFILVYIIIHTIVRVHKYAQFNTTIIIRTSQAG